jgi:hypothetical protein
MKGNGDAEIVNGGDAVTKRAAAALLHRGHAVSPQAERVRDLLQKNRIHNSRIRHAKIVIQRLNYV